jgi:penicillin-binding protein 1A
MPVSFLIPTFRYRSRRRWYARPQFYLPVALIVLLLSIFGAIYFGLVSSQLKREAATYDLSKLEQMESASLILDRNGKIFGQIYVENRETIPYDQLPRYLVDAVVAILPVLSEPRSKILSPATCDRAQARSPSNWRATVLRSRKKLIAGNFSKSTSPNASSRITTNRKSWSCI